MPIGAQSPSISIQRGSYQHQSDAFRVSSSLEGNLIPGWIGGTGAIGFSLYDGTGTALPSPELPLEPYPLESFSWTQFNGVIFGPPSPGYPSGTDLLFSGPVAAFYAIPEPATAFLFTLAGVIGLRRHRNLAN